MRRQIWILATLAALALIFTACSKSGGSVDASPLEKSFATADTSLKSAANTAVEAIKKADYSSALAELQKLAGNVKLTDEQKSAINNVIDQVKKALADMGNKAAGEANKAIGDAQKALGK